MYILPVGPRPETSLTRNGSMSRTIQRTDSFSDKDEVDVVEIQLVAVSDGERESQSEQNPSRNDPQASQGQAEDLKKIDLSA